MLDAVRPSPALSLSSHFWRSAGMAGAAGISIGVTSALPMSDPPESGAGVAGAVVPVDAGSAAAGGVESSAVGDVDENFFLKKLNMGRVMVTVHSMKPPGGVIGKPFQSTRLSVKLTE